VGKCVTWCKKPIENPTDVILVPTCLAGKVGSIDCM